MKPQIKENWLKALRSGEYSQTSERLHQGDGFCCLGVLTDLYLKENNEEWKVVYEDKKIYGITNMWCHVITSETQVLPDRVVEWAGLDNRYPGVYVKEKGSYAELAALNDKGMTFNEIADLIEESL